MGLLNKHMPTEQSISNTTNIAFDITLALYRVADKIYSDDFFKRKLHRCSLEILILVQDVFSRDNFDQSVRFVLEKKLDSILLLLKFGRSYYQMVNPINFSILIDSYESLLKEVGRVFGSTEKMADDKNGNDSIKVGEEASPAQYKKSNKKDEFVYLASHQLRTPLSAIGWYTEMLLSEDAGNINQQQKKYLKEVYENSQKMSQLIKTLLSISRLESGCFAVEIKPVDFSAVLENALQEFCHEILNKRITIEKIYGPSLPTVNADYHLSYIIFQNLISNSIKYTPEGGKIKIEISCLKNEKEANLKMRECVVVKISDNGCGIPKNQQEKIFTKLFRADNVRDKDSAGVGLGLYTVKLIADYCGFRIWFESPSSVPLSETIVGKEEGQGTTFCVAIPLAGMKVENMAENGKCEQF